MQLTYLKKHFIPEANYVHQYDPATSKQISPGMSLPAFLELNPPLTETLLFEAIKTNAQLPLLQHLVESGAPMTHNSIYRIIEKGKHDQEFYKLAIKMILKGGELNQGAGMETPLALSLKLEPFPGRPLLINLLLIKRAILYGEPSKEQLTALSSASEHWYEKYRDILRGSKDLTSPLSQIPQDIINIINIQFVVLGCIKY